MIEKGDYLYFNYRDYQIHFKNEDTTLICRYILSDDEGSYLKIIYCGDWWVMHKVGEIHKFLDNDLKDGYIYKTYCDLIAAII